MLDNNVKDNKKPLFYNNIEWFATYLSQGKMSGNFGWALIIFYMSMYSSMYVECPLTL